VRLPSQQQQQQQELNTSNSFLAVIELVFFIFADCAPSFGHNSVCGRNARDEIFNDLPLFFYAEDITPFKSFYTRLTHTLISLLN